MGNANISTFICALFWNKNSKFQLLQHMKFRRIQKCKEMFWFGSDWCKSTPTCAVIFLHLSTSHDNFFTLLDRLQLSWYSAVSPCSRAALVHRPWCSVEGEQRPRRTGPGGLKEKEQVMQFSLTAPARTFWLEFLMGQLNKESDS